MTPPPGPQKLGTPRGGASESGSGDDECGARPAVTTRAAEDWAANGEWAPVNGE